MSELKTTQGIVLTILKEDEKARNSDDYLYYIVCKRLLSERDMDIRRINLENFLLCRKGYGLPGFETVRRTRQKIQEKYPDLQSDEKVEFYKRIKQKAFESWAREGLL